MRYHSFLTFFILLIFMHINFSFSAELSEKDILYMNSTSADQQKALEMRYTYDSGKEATQSNYAETIKAYNPESKTGISAALSLISKEQVEKEGFTRETFVELMEKSKDPHFGLNVLLEMKRLEIDGADAEIFKYLAYPSSSEYLFACKAWLTSRLSRYKYKYFMPVELFLQILHEEADTEPVNAVMAATRYVLVESVVKKNATILVKKQSAEIVESDDLMLNYTKTNIDILAECKKALDKNPPSGYNMKWEESVLKSLDEAIELSRNANVLDESFKNLSEQVQHVETDNR